MTAALGKRLLLALAALGLVALLSLREALGAVGLARLVVVAVGAVGVAVLLWRARTRGALPTAPKRLDVIARSGLSTKCTVALVEVDGAPYLIAFGDSFAQMLPADPLPLPAPRFSMLPVGGLQ